MDGYHNIIESLNREIEEASGSIREEARDDESAKLLMAVPGIGYCSALLIVSEIGDVNRFPDSSHLCSCSGSTPSTYQSGNVSYHGSITKTGSRYLRWVLTECARSHIRSYSESSITRFSIKTAARKGDAKAIVAAASKLLKVAYWMLKEKRPYHS
jgi:transposase